MEFIVTCFHVVLSSRLLFPDLFQFVGMLSFLIWWVLFLSSVLHVTCLIIGDHTIFLVYYTYF